MITIVGIERLMNWMQDHNANYWKAFDNDRSGDSRRVVASNFDKENSNSDDAIRSLRGFLELYTVRGVRLYIWAVDKKTNTKGGYYTWFEMAPIESKENSSGMNGIPQGYVNEKDVSQQIAEALLKYQQEERIKKLEEELRDAKRLANEGDSLNRIVGNMEPYLPHIVQSLFPNVKLAANQSQATISGPGEKTTEEVEQSLARSLDVLARKFDNLDEILEKLAQKAEEDPDTLNSALTFL